MERRTKKYKIQKSRAHRWRFKTNWEMCVPLMSKKNARFTVIYRCDKCVIMISTKNIVKLAKNAIHQHRTCHLPFLYGLFLWNFRLDWRDYFFRHHWQCIIFIYTSIPRNDKYFSDYLVFSWNRTTSIHMRARVKKISTV